LSPEEKSEKKESSHPYSLQLGSYRTLERANTALSRYSTKGLSPYWVKADLGEKGTWYRVFVGHFKKMEEADKFKQAHNLAESVLKKIRYANLIGIYKTEDEFLDKMISLRKVGYSPYVIKDEGGGIRLFTGAFQSKAGAEKQHLGLQSQGFNNKIVKR
jgi:cell division protein FtsN